MKNQYYDKWEFDQILELSKTNPYEANYKYEQYLKKYPKDYCTYCYYAAKLITTNDFDKAKQILDFVSISIKERKEFLNVGSRLEDVKRDLLFARLKLWCYQGKYEQLYKFSQRHHKEIADVDASVINFYCMRQLGLLDLSKREINNYLFRQIVEYRENEFLEHIQKHLEENIDLETPISAIFCSNFPISKVISEIKKFIPSNKRLFSGFIEDKYIFKYDGCGKVDNKSVNYFAVITFHNTKDMITIYPINYGQNLQCVDLNYLVENTNNSKKESRIDRFNRKYKRN